MLTIYDNMLLKATRRSNLVADRNGGLRAAGLAMLVLGTGVVWVEPAWGIPLLAAGAVAVVLGELSGRLQGD
ncbi:MAG: hypothetical protein PVF46_06340 [Lysobacterales bacterium]|jgi:hypothetical protein